MTYMVRISIIVCSLFVSIICNTDLHAESKKHDCETGNAWCRESGKECRSERHGKCGKRKGDWYGARRAVTSSEDARSQFVEYFAGQKVSISDITEKPWRFEADVKNQNGDIIDRVIIDKRSGRIRSTY